MMLIEVTTRGSFHPRSMQNLPEVNKGL